MGKLVRDLIPDLIRADGGNPGVHKLDDAEYEKALHDKLLEEAAELRSAGLTERLDEMGDVYEVLMAIASHAGLRHEEVIEAAARKRKVRGGFKERLWLE